MVCALLVKMFPVNTVSGIDYLSLTSVSTVKNWTAKNVPILEKPVTIREDISDNTLIATYRFYLAHRGGSSAIYGFKIANVHDPINKTFAHHSAFYHFESQYVQLNLRTVVIWTDVESKPT